VKRNPTRFPADFMIRLTTEESEGLRCQFGTSNSRGGRRYPPYAFTEHGVAMLSSVLNSKRAIQMNIQIIRAFIKLRDAVATHKELARSIQDLEQDLERTQKTQGAAITIVAKEVRDLDLRVKDEFQALRVIRKNKRHAGFIIPAEKP
jgi:phage regulator Rha-like protein